MCDTDHTVAVSMGIEAAQRGALLDGGGAFLNVRRGRALCFPGEQFRSFCLLPIRLCQEVSVVLQCGLYLLRDFLQKSPRIDPFLAELSYLLQSQHSVAEDLVESVVRKCDLRLQTIEASARSKVPRAS